MSYILLDIHNLIRHFLCCTPLSTLNSFVPKGSHFIHLEKQQEILEKTINSDLIKKYPIKKSYQRLFLKWLMNKVEEEGEEIHDDIYTTYCNLIQDSTPDESIHYRHFPLEDDCISIKESTNIISEGTTGLCSWQGAIDLAQWCIENKKELFGKNILELGCGVGLTGLCVIKKCSPKQYIFTDCHKTALHMICQNVKLNLLHSEAPGMLNSKQNRLKLQLKYNYTNVEIMELRWEDIDKYVNEKWIVPDVVIGADILYDTDLFYTLVSGLNTFLSFENRYAIIATTIRNLDTFSQFLYLLNHYNLYFDECSTPKQTVQIQLTDLPIKILKIYQKR